LQSWRPQDHIISLYRSDRGETAEIFSRKKNNAVTAEEPAGKRENECQSSRVCEKQQPEDRGPGQNEEQNNVSAAGRSGCRRKPEGSISGSRQVQSQNDLQRCRAEKSETAVFQSSRVTLADMKNHGSAAVTGLTAQVKSQLSNTREVSQRIQRMFGGND